MEGVIIERVGKLLQEREQRDSLVAEAHDRLVAEQDRLVVEQERLVQEQSGQARRIAALEVRTLVYTFLLASQPKKTT